MSEKGHSRTWPVRGGRHSSCVTDSELQAIFDQIVADLGNQGTPVVLNLDAGRLHYSPPKLFLAGSSARFDIPRTVADPPSTEDLNAGGVEAFAGSVRAFLEYHRVVVLALGTYKMTMEIHAVLGGNYGGAGKGGGVIYNAPPMTRAANAAAADYVTRTYGPQSGRLRHPIYGLLFRTEREVTHDVAALAAPTLVYAAVWREDMEARAHDLPGLLRGLDTRALVWWTQLASSEAFNKLSEAVHEFTPLPEEIAMKEGYEAEAWRPLEALIDRATAVGVAAIR